MAETDSFIIIHQNIRGNILYSPWPCNHQSHHIFQNAPAMQCVRVHFVENGIIDNSFQIFIFGINYLTAPNKCFADIGSIILEQFMLHIKSKPIRKQNRKNDDTSGVSLPERVNLPNVCNTANQPKNHIPVIVTRAFQLGDSLHGLFMVSFCCFLMALTNAPWISFGITEMSRR